MSKSQTTMAEEISRHFIHFLKEQLGEHPTSVLTFVSGNMFTVRAENCLAPGEQKLAQNEKHWQLLQEVKTRQFDKVKPLLKKQLEELTGCAVLNIHSIVGKDGVRFELFTVGGKVENRLLESREVAS